MWPLKTAPPRRCSCVPLPPVSVRGKWRSQSGGESRHCLKFVIQDVTLVLASTCMLKIRMLMTKEPEETGKHIFLKSPPCVLGSDSALSGLLAAEGQCRSTCSGFSVCSRDAVGWPGQPCQLTGVGLPHHSAGGLTAQPGSLPETAQLVFSEISKAWTLVCLEIS